MHYKPKLFVFQYPVLKFRIFPGVIMIKNKEKTLQIFYYMFSILSLFTAVCEIPFAVFIGPVFMFAAFVLYSHYFGREVSIDTVTVWFFVFTVAYSVSVLNPARGIYYQIYVYLQAFLMFVMGCNAFSECKPSEKRKKLEVFFFVVSVMYFIYVSVTLVYYYTNTAHDLVERFYYSFWYGQEVVKPATVIVMMLVFPMTFGLYSIFFMKLPYKICGIIFDVGTIAFCFWSGSRTMLFFFPILVAGTAFAYFIFVKKKIKPAIVFASSVAVLCAAVIVLAKVFKEQLYERFHDYGFYRIIDQGFVSSLRNQYALNVLKDFSVFYMGGGKHSAELGTPHNIWLYLYDHGGFIPFFFYCIFTVLMVINGVKMLLSKKVELRMKFFVYIMFAVILLEYFLEPFILPLPSFYIMGLFLMGVITSEARREPKKNKYRRYKKLKL